MAPRSSSTRLARAACVTVFLLGLHAVAGAPSAPSEAIGAKQAPTAMRVSRKLLAASGQGAAGGPQPLALDPAVANMAAPSGVAPLSVATADGLVPVYVNDGRMLLAGAPAAPVVVLMHPALARLDAPARQAIAAAAVMRAGGERQLGARPSGRQLLAAEWRGDTETAMGTALAYSSMDTSDAINAAADGRVSPRAAAIYGSAATGYYSPYY